MTHSEALTPTELNQTLTDADTEYSVTIPPGTKYFSLQCRTAFDCRFSWTTGKVATPTAPYSSVKSGGSYSSPEKLSWSGTLYLASSEAAVVVEVIAWEAT